jgi:hypothetical protein
MKYLHGRIISDSFQSFDGQQSIFKETVIILKQHWYQNQVHYDFTMYFLRHNISLT